MISHADRALVRAGMEAFLRWQESPDYQSPSALDGHLAITETRGYRKQGNFMACKETRVAKRSTGPTPSTLADNARAGFRALQRQSPIKAKLLVLDHLKRNQAQVRKQAEEMGIKLSRDTMRAYILDAKTWMLNYL